MRQAVDYGCRFDVGEATAGSVFGIGTTTAQAGAAGNLLAMNNPATAKGTGSQGVGGAEKGDPVAIKGCRQVHGAAIIGQHTGCA